MESLSSPSELVVLAQFVLGHFPMSDPLKYCGSWELGAGAAREVMLGAAPGDGWAHLGPVLKGGWRIWLVVACALWLCAVWWQG